MAEIGMVRRMDQGQEESSNSSGDNDILSPFPEDKILKCMIQRPGSNWTCANYIAVAGLNRPRGAARAYFRTREQMSPLRMQRALR